MSFRLLSSHSRSLAQKMNPAYITRSLHSPFIFTGTKARSTLRAPANKQTEEKYTTTAAEHDAAFAHTHVVCQPDLTTTFNQVPLGAYPISAPYTSFTNAETTSK